MIYQNKSVLIVDDTPANLELLFEQLKTQNLQVFVAESGASALEQVQYIKPDLILLDVLMPGMDGFETCRLLKANPQTCEIPVIFLTALSETYDKVRGFEVGGVDYITKPTSEAEVQARIQTHLTIRELQRYLYQQNEWLEERVTERTAQLVQTNEELLRANRALKEEITRRKQNEQEKIRVLTMFEKQSDQLSTLTNLLMRSQQKQRLELAQRGPQQVLNNLSLANSTLDFIDQALLAQTPPALIQRHIKHSREALQRAESYLKSIQLDSQRQNKRYLRESPLLKLTNREREVLQLVIEGKSSADIANQLKLSKKSVTTYRGRILKKLGLTDVTELIGFALKHNLTDMES